MKIKLFTIPNILTLSNLVCGALAVVSALVYNQLSLAFGLVILAAVFDFFDGFVARLLQQSSPIGLQLDSLADDISFGLAPSAILYALYLQESSVWSLPEWVGLSLFILAAFSALRLAKFNIDDTQRTEFCGLPTPAAAMFCASLGFITEQCGVHFSCELLLGVAWVLSALLVSPIRMFALKFHGFGWAGNELRYLFIVACVVLLVALRTYAIPCIIALYVVVSTVRWLITRGATSEN